VKKKAETGSAQTLKPDPLDLLAGTPSPLSPGRRLPDWYPDWAEELADLYFSGTTSVFVLHGNVHDLVYCPAGPDGEDSWCDIPEFLATKLFGAWDVVLSYDLGRGLRPLPGTKRDRLKSMLKHTTALGQPSRWPHSPEKAFFLLDRFLQRKMLREAQSEPGTTSKSTSVALVFQHAQYIVPAQGIASSALGHGSLLVRLLDWAQNPYLKRLNIAFCLIADRLTEVNTRLVQNPYVATVRIPMPSREDRSRFIRKAVGSKEQWKKISDFTPEELAELSNGLSLVNLNVVVAQARTGGERVAAQSFKRLKKTMIERQCSGLLEFFEPKHGLDMVVGHVAAKKRLRSDAGFIMSGKLDFAPMGYLICGPVGTGKTFLAECYAGSIGIPCVKLLNFRSKYVGETEGNLEHLLTVLRSLGPVVVIVDEADAALGTREASGDSGTSSRVFSIIASQMGDTRYRGKIVWMLLTSRPDNLPVDLKRQGRAEVHIPLFYPTDEEEFRAMFTVMARKNKVKSRKGAFDHLKPDDRGLSGSDIESVVLGANRHAMTAGRKQVTKNDVDAAVKDFVPSAQGLEREAQELAAVLECTQLSFLPERWRAKVSKSNGRVAIQERLVAIRQILES